MGAVAERVGPGPGGFAVAVLESDELFGAVGPYAEQAEYAGSGLLQADVEVDAICPDIHVVHLGQIAVMNVA